MLILGLDSATNMASLALLKDGELLAEINFNTAKTHSQRLMPMLDWLLKETDLKLDDIDGYAVAIGPGSFTGLRIGLATIKTLAYIKDKPIATVSTLDGLAHNLAGTHGLVCPILNARKKEVYTALYRVEGDEVTRISDYQALSIEGLVKSLSSLEEKVTVIGDALPVYKEDLAELPNLVGGYPTNALCRAAQIASLGYQKILQNEIENVYELEPFYIRESEAELKWRKNNLEG